MSRRIETTNGVFATSLNSTICWVHTQQSNWHSNKFRSPKLLPGLSHVDYKRIFSPSTFAYDEVQDAMHRIIQNRELLTEGYVNNVDSSKVKPGRILRHNFYETTFTCTPKERTEGFFDELDLPPWDLWIATAKESNSEILLSWVPANLIDLVDEGVQSSAEENILWVDDEFIFT